MTNPAQDYPPLLVRLTALAYGGASIGTVVSPKEWSGKKALVRGGVPGEDVEIEIQKDQPHLSSGRVLKVITPSPARISAPCPYFEVCGGCDLQHIGLEYQRKLKVELAESTLKHQGGLEPANGAVLLGSGLPGFGYRSRIDLHVSRGGKIGFCRAESREVVDVEECLLAKPALNAALGKLREQAVCLGQDVSRAVIEEHGRDIYVLLRVHEEEDGRPPALRLKALRPLFSLFSDLKITLGRKVLYQQSNFKEEKAEGSSLPYGHFSQVNQAANKILVETVSRLVREDKVTDLYSGAGNLSMPLAENGRIVDAVEIDAALIEYGRRTAASNNLATIKFHRRSAEEYVQRTQISGAVILDPPRCGAKHAVKHLSSRDVSRIIYVSCNVATLARDLKTLASKGFALKHLFVIDMFPQTHHIELVAVSEGHV